MLNPFAEIDWKPGPEKRRKFAISLIIGFPVLALVFEVIALVFHGAFSVFPLWLGGVGAGLGILFLLLPGIVLPFYILWYGIACCISIVIGNLLLGAVYFLVFTPIGIALRCFGKDPLRKGPDRTVSTYWQDGEKIIDPKRYYQQY